MGPGMSRDGRSPLQLTVRFRDVSHTSIHPFIRNKRYNAPPAEGRCNCACAVRLGMFPKRRPLPHANPSQRRALVRAVNNGAMP